MSVDILINALRGIAADGTDHPQIDFHRRIAQGALDRYAAAQFPRELPADAVLVDAAENRVLSGCAVRAAIQQDRRPVDPLRGMRVEDLPACGP